MRGENCFWDANSHPLYSNKKAAQDIINIQLFTQLELPNNFSISSNKHSRTDNSEVEVDDITILFSKTIDFLSATQKEDCKLSKLPVSSSATVATSQTIIVASFISKPTLIEGIKGYDEPLTLG